MVDELLAPSRPGRPYQLLRLVQHALFVTLLALGAIRSVLDDRSPAGVAAVSLLIVGWYVAEGWLRSLPWPAESLWLLGLTVSCLVAVWFSADFAWTAFALYVVLANGLRPVPAAASIGVVALAVGGLLVWRWPAEGHWAGQVIGPVVGAAVAAALVGVTRFAASETAERQRLLDELVAARDDLAAAHLQAGARAERERLAGEIHDTLAQGFTSVLLAARRAGRASDEGDQGAVRRELRHLEQLASEGVEHARRLVRELPPVELDDRPLPLALALLAEPDAGRAMPAVDVRVDGEPRPLLPAVELALLRVAQEGVTNARRHGHAERVVVTLTYQPAGVRLDVVDDGIGFDPAARSPGYGLAGMRSRVEQLGGRFTIESTPGQGTAINAEVSTAAEPRVESGVAR